MAGHRELAPPSNESNDGGFRNKVFIIRKLAIQSQRRSEHKAKTLFGGPSNRIHFIEPYNQPLRQSKTAEWGVTEVYVL